METQIRIWRATPINHVGTTAPTFLVETTEKDRSKAEESARKEAASKTRLSNFNNWSISLERLNVRKDKFGKYIKHHQ